MHHLSSRYIPCDGRLTASAYFNPHSPHGERPSVSTGGMILVDFNPRSPSGERQCRKGTRTMNLIISIHAPRLGSDFLLVPLVWNDHRFQSTLPAGERQSSSLLCVVLHYISTHALRMGSDGSLICDFDPGKFQSTPPAWGATGGFPLGFYGVSISIHPPRMGSDNGRCIVLGALAISIHAPRMGSDCTSPGLFYFFTYFNPRSPHGERLFAGFSQAHGSVFQSTLPAWGATDANQGIGLFNGFQSTLPAWGATMLFLLFFHLLSDFNPRSPHGERRIRRDLLEK